MANLEVQNNPFTSILMVEAADVEALPDADPAAGQRRLAVGADHLLYLVSDAGVKTAVGGAGIANPLATDSLWDAAGDLVQGTGANTAAKLTAGTAGKVLTSNGAAAALTWETPAGGGAMATDALWDAAGDLAQGTGANTGAKLSAGLAGQMLRSAGAAAANAWAYPPGYEFDYAQITSSASITATSGATASTVVSGASVTYDGSTIILIQFVCSLVEPPSGQSMYAVLYDGSTELGYIARGTATAAAQRVPWQGARRLTPSAGAHTYHIKGFVDAGTGTLFAGAGTAGTQMPAFIRITRV